MEWRTPRAPGHRHNHSVHGGRRLPRATRLALWLALTHRVGGQHFAVIARPGMCAEDGGCEPVVPFEMKVQAPLHNKQQHEGEHVVHAVGQLKHGVRMRRLDRGDGPLLWPATGHVV